MSLPSLTCGTSLDTSIHYYHDHGQEYHGQEYHDQDNQEYNRENTGQGDETIYPCLFDILNCHQTFTNPEYWKTHVLSHFRTFEPPAIARCPFCTPSLSRSGSISVSGSGSEPTSPSSPTSPGSPSPSPSPSDSDSGSGPGSESGSRSELDGTFVNTPHTRAWDALLDHLVSHYQHQHNQSQAHSDNQTRHREQQHNQPHGAKKPDFELLRYLYTLRLITEEQWKAAVQLGVVPGSPTDRRGEQSVRQRVGRADEPFWGFFSPRRERQRVRHGGDPGRAPGRGAGNGPGRIVLSSC